MKKVDRIASWQKILQLNGLTDDKKAVLLELVATIRYGLVWEDRVEDVEERLRERLPVLIEDTNLRIIGHNSEHELPRLDHELLSDNSRIINVNSCENKIKIYVFSPGTYAWDDDFAEVIDRMELCALPEAIYQAYKNVLPKKRVQRKNKEPI